MKRTCIYCGSSKKITIDHIVPLSKGGDDHYHNRTDACLPCNNGKANYYLDDWIRKGQPQQFPKQKQIAVVPLPSPSNPITADDRAFIRKIVNIHCRWRNPLAS